MSEYKDGRGDYYLAEGKREERAGRAVQDDGQLLGDILDLFLPFIDRGPAGYREAQERIDERMWKAPVLEQMLAGRAVQDDGLPTVAVWRVRQESDRSWTITDDKRPGFVTTGETLQDAVEDLLPVMALWDETDEMRRAAPPLHDPEPPNPLTYNNFDVELVVPFDDHEPPEAES